MHSSFKWTVSGLIAAALLTGCGGANSDAPGTAEPDVPEAAMVSPESYTAWAHSLGARDSGEPLNLDRIDAAPTSESADPMSLD